jgi:secondary thiamine-phosphate synthase enzyme
MKIIKVQSTQREEMIDITEQVRDYAHRFGLDKDCVVHLFVQHTTCGLTVNENADPDVKSDILSALRDFIPQHGMGFKHAEGNSDAHLKASLMSSSLTVPCPKGQLRLGQWQGIFLCEFDGPRERQIAILVSQ